MIFHSVRGSEYTATRCTTAGARLGVTQSMARVGSALDNAVAEAVHSILKAELVAPPGLRYPRADPPGGHGRITEFYNLRRRHSACGQQSRIDYEHLHQQQADGLISA